MTETGPPPKRPADAASYTPMITEDHAKRIRQWHESAYNTGKAEARSDQTVTYLGRTLAIPPEIMPITRVSHLLGEAVLAEVRESDRVLDMGTGSGVNAILAASQAADVLAVDINPHAVEAARRNAERNGVADRIEVRHSDVFSDVDGRFDLIVFDPPFRWFAPRDQFEVAMTDENYRAMTEFFAAAKRHLTPTGRMLIFFGTSGDLPYLTHLADQADFRTEIIAQEHLEKDDWRVDYFTFRMTRDRRPT
ncbi:methyltransferase [Actinokineospora iranica]|uniref:Release factor glutamine methyltransferase n=1 Tax=Actinokineospora iranica TaxID=1271860 RepID=A0A1G6J3P7_9PSEU|nr:methyltransferase [Actinokineospora iranica]SDC13330.1 release factor glutamine methyltransferase [Actinokineospora iranica]